MPRLRYTFFVILICLISFGNALAAEGPNLITNSGAEYNTKGRALPDYWTNSGSQLNAIYSTDRTQFNTGTASFKIETEQDNHSGTIVYQNRVMLAPGTKIKLGLSYKTGGFLPGLTNKITLVLRRHQGWSTYFMQTYYLDTDNTSWNPFEVDFTIPADLTDPLVPISVTIGIQQAKGILWIDDLSIRVIEAPEDNTSPNPPTELVANRRAENVVQLKWNASSEASDGDSPAMYKVYRSTVRGFTPTSSNLIYEAAASDTSFLDYNVIDGVRYYYVIAAMDKMGNIAYSDEAVANQEVVYGRNLLTNPSLEEWDLSSGKPIGWSSTSITNITQDGIHKVHGDFSVKIKNDSPEYHNIGQAVTLTKDTNYTLVAWIKGENIRKDVNGNGATVFAAGIPGITMYDGTFDWQFICLEFNSGNTTSLVLYPYLHFSTGTVWFDGFGLYSSIDGVPPLSPTNIVATPENGVEKVHLSWDAPGKAPDGDYADKYRVYRGSSLENMELKAELPATVTSWTDEKASGDSVYYYYVTALDKVENESDPSNHDMVEKRSKVNGKVVVLAEDDTYKGLADVTLSLEGTELGTTSVEGGLFEIKWLVAGDYELLVQAKNYQRKKVPFSITAGEDLMMEDIMLDWDTIRPEKPTELNADGDSHVGIIVLDWVEPVEAEDGEFADSYNIYRSSTSEIHRTEKFFLASTNETIYHDIGAEEDFGKTFYYLVEAVDGAGNVSWDASNIASAKMITPPIPNPVGPINRELVADVAPVFEWEMPDNPDLKKFLVQISTDPSFPSDKTMTEEHDELIYTWPEKLEQSIWYWRVKARFNEVESSWSDINEFVTISADNTALAPYINVVPSIFRDDHVKIGYFLTNEADVELRVFNLGGKLVANLVSLKQAAGYHEEVWTGKDLQGGELANGLYIIQLLVNSGEGKKEKVLKKIVIYR